MVFNFANKKTKEYFILLFTYRIINGTQLDNTPNSDQTKAVLCHQRHHYN